MPGQTVKYGSVPLGDRLHQGEILAGLVLIRQTLSSIGTENVAVDERTHPFVIVLTQDCDLSQDADARDLEVQAAQDSSRLNDPDFHKKLDNAPKYKIDNVLLCPAVPTAELRSTAAQQKELWKRVTQNLDPRFHCIEAVPAGQDTAAAGIPSLGCDFRRFFTVPADEVYKRLELRTITRRSRLVTPYAEHLLHRFCNFQARIPLPENHEVPL